MNPLNLVGAYLQRDEGETRALPDFNARGDLYRQMEVRSSDTKKRTVELAFSSEAEVQRWFGKEVLDHDPASVRLDRLRNGGAVLVNHDWDDHVGVVEAVSIDGDRMGRATVRFGRSARADEIFQDIADGIRRQVSVGYRVHEAKLETTGDNGDTYRITDWEPFEISVTSVAADISVGINRAAEISQEEPPAERAETTRGDGAAITVKEIATMTIKNVRDAAGNLVRAEVDDDGKILKVLEVIEEAGADVRSAAAAATKAELERNATITELGEKYGQRELADKAIKAGTSVADFQRELLDAMDAPAAEPARATREQRGNQPLSEVQTPTIGLSDREVRQYSMMRAIRACLPTATQADRAAARFEMECSETALRQLGKSTRGFFIPEDVLRAFNAGGAANTPAGATSGANIVAHELLAGSFIEMLRNRTTIMRLGTTMGGLVGNVDIPKQTGGATAYWLGEGADATEGTPTIGQLSLSPKTVGAYTDLTRRLMIQSTPDAETIVRNDLANAVAQAIDKAGYYGAGSAIEPKGIKNYTGINAVDFGVAGKPTFAELVAMESEIAADNADINQMAYVGNAKLRGWLKSTAKFGTGTEATIWEPGNTVNGYRAEITNQVADDNVFFGNFADLIIGLWGGLDVQVDPYSLSKSGGVRIVVFQEVDFVLRRVESFCFGSSTVVP